MTHAYDKDSEGVVKAYRRIHANGEQTHVYILSTGERYTVVASDTDPREFHAVAGEAIAFAPTAEAAQERAQAWMEQNPKGIAADSAGKGNIIIRMLKKLNQWGNQMQQQQTEQTQQTEDS